MSSSQLVESNDEILFLSDSEAPEVEADPWLVLIVDDDESVHLATQFAFREFRFDARPICFLNAYSAAQARVILGATPAIACAFLDVVMEYESAGLDLVGYIRKDLANAEIRLILRTGQAGYAPELSVIQDYDINDYKEKAFTTGDHLHTSLTAALRCYQQIMTIQENRKGLEMVIEASARLLVTHEVDGFAAGILTQISTLIHALPDGLVCVAVPRGGTGIRVVVAAGRYVDEREPQDPRQGGIGTAVTDAVAEAVAEVLASKANRFGARVSYLYIPVTKLGEVVVVINTSAPIKELDRKLLELFSINIAIGFDNSCMVQEIENLAFVDQLTGLPNLFTLLRHMEEGLEAGRDYLLGMADIDNFEAVNDGLGRDVGDHVLKYVADEFRALEGLSFVARAGGDVFGFLMPADPGIDKAEQLRRIATHLRKTLLIENSYIGVGVTIGAAVFRAGEVKPGVALGNAGVAMKNAKGSRQGGYLLFEDRMNATLRTRLDINARMHKALENGDFFLLYQPQICLLSGKVVGVEALVRWRDGDKTIPPDQFIPVAEHSGLIIPLGKWVLETALAQQNRWRAEGMVLRMAVNVSTRQLIEDDGFVEFVSEAIARHGGKPGELELEVTETMVISDMESGIGRLRQIRDTGVQIAIDDFGTGYSSLGQLRHLPVHRLKIDRVFIQGLDRSEDDFHIAEMIVRMGHAIKLSVLAEGVETEAQQEILKTLGCDELQGYLHAKPLPPEQLAPLFREKGLKSSAEEPLK